MNAGTHEISILEFKHVYSHPGDMTGVAREFYSMFEKTVQFLLPLQVDSSGGLGWVILELLNNAVRSPVSIAMNTGVSDLTKIDFYTDIIIRKSISNVLHDGGIGVEISVLNRGRYSEGIINSIQKILSGGMSILDCEEQFMLKGSFTGNGGLGIILSKKNVENALGGNLTLSWHDGFYDFKISFIEREISFNR